MKVHTQEVYLNGFTTQKGNYMFGAALTLAWQSLISEIIKQKIQVQILDPKVLMLVHNFNHCPFSKHILSEKCYLAKAGFGNKLIKQINKELAKRFPQKTTAPLPPVKDNNCLIAYAYLTKNLKFTSAFQRTDVYFKEKKLHGFEAFTPDQKKQVLVHQYDGAENFIISLKTTFENDQIYFIKTQRKIQAEEAVEMIKNLQEEDIEKLEEADQFSMPLVSIKAERVVQQLCNKKLKNKNFEHITMTSLVETIKLNINETGVKVQNEGYIMLQNCISGISPKQLHLNRPFWVLMKERKKYPYLISFITQPIQDELAQFGQQIGVKSSKICCCPI